MKAITPVVFMGYRFAIRAPRLTLAALCQLRVSQYRVIPLERFVAHILSISQA